MVNGRKIGAGIVAALFLVTGCGKIAQKAAGIFTRVAIPDSVSGTAYTISQCGRYFWVRFDMDDTASATTDGGGSLGRNSIQDFTLTYSTSSSPARRSVRLDEFFPIEKNIFSHCDDFFVDRYLVSVYTYLNGTSLDHQYSGEEGSGAP